jgi:hypothetical protein
MVHNFDAINQYLFFSIDAIMRRKTLLFFICMLLISICNGVNANTCRDGGISVSLDPKTKPEPRPRSIVYIPVECYYSEGEIYISGEDSISGIEATVTNLSSNVSWSAESNNNYLQMSVSSASGDYYIVITLADGREYEGYYTLP